MAFRWMALRVESERVDPNSTTNVAAFVDMKYIYTWARLASVVFSNGGSAANSIRIAFPAGRSSRPDCNGLCLGSAWYVLGRRYSSPRCVNRSLGNEVITAIDALALPRFESVGPTAIPSTLALACGAYLALAGRQSPGSRMEAFGEVVIRSKWSRGFPERAA